MIRFGANPVAWSNDDDRTIGARISPRTCLDDIARIGFDGIEKGHKLPATPEGIATEPGGRALAHVSGWHSLNLLIRGVEEQKAAMQPCLDTQTAAGSNAVIVCETSDAIHTDDRIPVSDRPRLAPADWPLFGPDVEAVAEFAGAQGITLVYHHRMGTVVETPEEIDLLMDHTGPATHLLLDTGHCVFGGGGPAAVLARHAARTGHVHARNVRPAVTAEVRAQGLSLLEAARRGVLTVPGDPESGVDLSPCLRTRAHAGDDGWLVNEAEQDPEVRDPVRDQSMGRAAVKAMAR